MKYLTFQKLTSEIKKDFPKFSLEEKDSSKLQRFLCVLLYFFKYKHVWTTLYPKIWLPITKDIDKKHNSITLQHEWVHMKDCRSFFGLSSHTWFLNVLMYSILYIFPHWLSLLSLLAIFGSNLWLISLVFLLPIPAPFRYIAELRAYRRSIELTPDDFKQERIKKICDNLSSMKYYCCMPFKKLIAKQLVSKPSPYKEEMDKAMKLDF